MIWTMANAKQSCTTILTAAIQSRRFVCHTKYNLIRFISYPLSSLSIYTYLYIYRRVVFGLLWMTQSKIQTYFFFLLFMFARGQTDELFHTHIHTFSSPFWSARVAQSIAFQIHFYKEHWIPFFSLSLSLSRQFFRIQHFEYQFFPPRKEHFNGICLCSQILYISWQILIIL